jgi:hypothetical protein
VSIAPQLQNPLPANRVPAVRSAKWLNGLYPRGSTLQEREENCVEPTVFVYTHDDTRYVLNVPEGSVGTVVNLVEKGAFDELKTLSEGWSCKPDKHFPSPIFYGR